MVQALAFAELFLGGLFLTSAITKEPIAELLSKGLTNSGKAKQKAEGESPSDNWGLPFRKGLAPPFRQSDVKEWNRSDAGVDVQFHPGATLHAIGDGVVSIEHDPKGFGTYPVLHLTTGESFYYGHTIPVAKNGERVHAGDVIAKPNPQGQNSPPNWLEFGEWTSSGPRPKTGIKGQEPGDKIRSWLEKLVGAKV